MYWLVEEGAYLYDEMPHLQKWIAVFHMQTNKQQNKISCIHSEFQTIPQN